ncbi:FAD-binding protein [Polycladidibacter stylochi]|uniref:FAD-binding protein n=1 Tax=Polycladidibacter stylochi TaxID=1807766 RepID=UPI000829CEE4|nr:FAD-binding protein [Pseudovibrio stylochi]
MTATQESYHPQTSCDLEKVIAWAAAENEPLEIIGNATKRNWGRPVQAAHLLSTDQLSGVVDYQPDELIMTAKAGTPVSEIESLLDKHNQMLAFEPLQACHFWHETTRPSTIGGIFATNQSGSRRLKAGAARDFILGLEAVSGRGERFKAGGKVQKNVTGYDIARGFCSSWGTLFVATEITFKVLPKPETECTLALLGLSGQLATSAMSQAMASTCEVSSAAYLTSKLAELCRGNPLAEYGSSTLLRLEGTPLSVRYRRDKLINELKHYAQIEVMEAENSISLWNEISNASVFARESNPLWRISMAPSHAQNFVEAIRSDLPAQILRDWAGGLLWLSVEGDDDYATPIREYLDKSGGGYATLVRASAAIRSQVPVFQPQLQPLEALSRSLKHQFDPAGILNPGRMNASF